jgi:hypothetical protein
MPDKPTPKTTPSKGNVIKTKFRSTTANVPHVVIDWYGAGMKDALTLYTALWRFANWDDLTANVGTRALWTVTGFDHKRIEKDAIHLQKLGLLKFTPGNRAKPTEYELLIPPFPPPPELVAKYWPKGWQPPDRAIRALKSAQDFLADGVAPLDVVPSETKKEGAVAVTAPEYVPVKGAVKEAAECGTGYRTSEVPVTAQVREVLPHNKSFTNSLNTNERTSEEEFVRKALNKFKSKSPQTSVLRMEEFYLKAVNLSKDDLTLAKQRLESAIGVVLQAKQTDDPEGLLWKSLERGWKPRPSSKRDPVADMEKKRREIEEENKRVEEENIKIQADRKGIPVDKLLEEFTQFFPSFDFEFRLRNFRSWYGHADSWTKAEQEIMKQEKPENRKRGEAYGS